MLIPAPAFVKTPLNKPINPFFVYPSLAPVTSKCPKFIIGIVAPELNFSTNISYTLNPERIHPITTRDEFICPGVNFVFSKKNCDIAHINPQNRNDNI